MADNPTRLMIIDDHDVILEHFSEAFMEHEDFRVIATLTSAAEAAEACRNHRPDLLIMDVCTEGGASGLDALKIVKAEHPDIKVIMMSGFDEISYSPRAREMGAEAFIMKTKGVDFFIATARQVLCGARYFPEDRTIPLPNGQPPFSDREMEILRLLCDYKKRPEIAQTLFLSENTVKRHIQNMLSKSGFDSTMELVIYVMNNGWINTKY